MTDGNPPGMSPARPFRFAAVPTAMTGREPIAALHLGAERQLDERALLDFLDEDAERGLFLERGRGGADDDGLTEVEEWWPVVAPCRLELETVRPASSITQAKGRLPRVTLRCPDVLSIRTLLPNAAELLI